MNMNDTQDPALNHDPSHPEPDTFDRAMQRFRLRSGRLQAVRRLVRWSAWWALGWGSVVLVARAGFEAEGQILWLGFAMLPVVWMLAAVAGWRRRPPERAVRALFDRWYARGGLLMWAGEQPLDGAWDDALGTPAAALRSPSEPRPRWRGRRSWGLLLAATTFLTAAFLLPTGWDLEADERPLEIDQQLDALDERIDLLDEEGILDEEEAEGLREDLERVREDASGRDPARAWETLDHLDESTAWAAQEGAEEAMQQGQQLAAAEALAETLESTDAAVALSADALAELSAMSAEAAAAEKLLGDETARALAELLKNGPMNRGDLGRLQAALGEGRQDLREMMERLRQAGLIDLEALKMGERMLGDMNDQDLQEYLDQHGMTAALVYCERPGQGGVSRGPGTADLTPGETREDGVDFQPEVLPPSALANLDDSELLGVMAVDPSAQGSTVSTQAGSALGGAAVGGGSAHTRSLLPRHRRAVRRFFERQPTAEPVTAEPVTEEPVTEETDPRGSGETNPRGSGEPEPEDP